MQTRNDDGSGETLVAVALIAGFVALAITDHIGLALALLAFLLFS